MNLKQLRLICEMQRNGFSVSRTADTLFTTQPAISAQIKLLEDELSLVIFNRKGKRITGLTGAGFLISEYASHILADLNNINQIAAEFHREDQGRLTIATTHTQARYALPKVIQKFSKQYPNVSLHIHQGSPTQITNMVVNGEADFAIATESISENQSLTMIPVYQWNRCILAPTHHPILKSKKLTLERIADFPIVTYDFAFTGRSIINKAFQENRLQPNIVLTALDSDVIKTYVKLGLGIGLLASMAYNKSEDRGLMSKDASHLFEPSTTYLGFKKGRYLRKYMLQFIEWFAPDTNINQIISQ